MLNRGAVITQRRRASHRLLGGRGDAINRFAADAIVLAARQAFIGAFCHALLIGAHELELERRRARIEHEDVHRGASVSRAAAARARANASLALSPYAEM